jgi:hypothetical protein
MAVTIAPSSATGPTARCSSAPTRGVSSRRAILSGAAAGATRYVAWDEAAQRPLIYDPERRRYDGDVRPALLGEYKIPTADGVIVCRPAFDLAARALPALSGGGGRAHLWSRPCRGRGGRSAPLAFAPGLYYAWSGVEQQTNATQIFRAISLLYVLTGSFEGEGGNVLFPSVPSRGVAGDDLITAAQRDRCLGLPERPIGPSRWEWVTTDEVYTAVLEQRPTPCAGWSGSARTSSWRMPTRGAGARRLPPSTSTSTRISS